MQSIWQTITAPPVTIPFSLMWLCVFALELIMLPERIRLARYGGYWYMCPYDYRTTQMVSGRRIWHRFASAAVAATWMWYTAMEHSPSTGNPDSSMGRVFGSYRNTVQFDCSVMTHHGTRNLRYRSGFRWSGLHSVRNNLGGRVRRWEHLVEPVRNPSSDIVEIIEINWRAWKSVRMMLSCRRHRR